MFSYFFIEYTVVFFQIISFLLLFSAIGVVIVRNPIYSILFLIIVFALTSLLFIILNLEFLAMVLVIVYLGAVCVLFLFVVMMLNIKLIELKREINFIPFLFVIFSLLFIFIFEQKQSFLSLGSISLLSMPSLVFLDQQSFLEIFPFSFSDARFFSLYDVWINDQMKNLGLVLYIYFVFQFILASLVLLVAMFGAIFLTLEVSSKSKKQLAFSQVVRSKSDFIF